MNLASEQVSHKLLGTRQDLAVDIHQVVNGQDARAGDHGLPKGSNTRRPAPCPELSTTPLNQEYTLKPN